MLYHLLTPLENVYGAFRVFHYVTFRVAMAILTAMLISFLLGPWVIAKLKEKQIGQSVRDDGPKSHLSKEGTPTMGGILIISATVLSTLFWSRLDVAYIWVALLVTIGYALIGFLDDLIKVTRKHSKGLSVRGKFKLEFIVAFLAAIFLCLPAIADLDRSGTLRNILSPFLVNYDTKLIIPFFKSIRPDLGIVYIVLIVLVILSASNSVNLTDGLDGLAIGPVMTAAITFLILAYVAGHAKIADYLSIRAVSGAGELAIFCGAIFGSGLGFLWFNTYPAQLFMGDVGSLSLGAALGIVAVIIKQEILLIIIGGVFVLESVSVIIQVLSYKISGKRIFRMAPVHHHFELKGWAEPKVIVRFWIVSIILALIALSTLKLR
jgi:phospho-N-acetylmuramoyl-pentapeptide-transferase